MSEETINTTTTNAGDSSSGAAPTPSEAVHTGEQATKEAKEVGTTVKVEPTQPTSTNPLEDKPEVSQAKPKFDAKGNKDLEKVYGTYTDLGLTPDVAAKAFANYQKSGDVNDIDYSALVDTLGAGKADAIMAVTQNYISERTKRTEAIKATVFEVAGGEENWNMMKEWANNEIDANSEHAQTLRDLGSMLGSNNEMNKYVASKIQEMFNNAPNTTMPAKMHSGDKAGNITKPQEMTASEFSKAYREAEVAGDHNGMKKLLEARRAARARGVK